MATTAANRWESSPSASRLVMFASCHNIGIRPHEHSLAAKPSTRSTLTCCHILRWTSTSYMLHSRFCTRLSSADLCAAVLAHRGGAGAARDSIAGVRGNQSRCTKWPRSVVSIKHEGISDLAGMSRSHLTVTMGCFRKRGLVRYSKNEPLRVNTPAFEIR